MKNLLKIILIKFKNKKVVYFFIISYIFINFFILIINKNSDINNFLFLNYLDLTILEKNYQNIIGEENIFYLKDTNRNKNINTVYLFSKNIYIPLNKEKNQNIFIKNYNQNDLLKLLINKERINSANIIYNSYLHNLEIGIPSYEFNLNNFYIETKKIIFYRVENILMNNLIEINNNIINLKNYKNNLIISYSDIPNLIVKMYKKNILYNKNISSFENGLWQKIVSDCSKGMSGEANFGMSLSNDATDGKNSLLISSKNHNACTSHNFNTIIKKGRKYKLFFDYKNLKGNKIKYYFRLSSDKNDYTKSEVINTENNNWNTFETIIEPKFNFNKIQIFFYSPSNGTEEIVNLYDNVKLEEYIFDKELTLEKLVDNENDIELANNILLNPGENKFEYIINNDNLLKENNSFENGLWSQNISDCCNKNEGKAIIYMNLNNDASDGNNSLELISKNHCACTSKTFNIEILDNIKYKLSFDYKNIKGDKFQYYYRLRNNNNLEEDKSETLDTKNHNWNHFETIIDTKLKYIKEINIHFYSSSDGKNEVINLYDNVKLEEYLPKDMDSYYLYAHQEVDESPKLNNLEFKSINKFKNKVVLHGVKNSFLLAYPEEYNENLKVYPYKDKTTVSLANLSVPANYNVPEVESNRQATKDEINGFIASSSISATGLKFISKNFDGSIRNDNLSNPPVLASFFNKPINEDIHYQINNYSNAWWIDIDDICKNKKLCKENVDGTYDISLLVENKWNKILNITIFILGLLFLINLGYLIYYRFRRNDK